MLPGKQFKLIRSTVGIHLVNGTAKVIMVPPDTLIQVLSGPNANGSLHDRGVVYTLWQEKTLALFTSDLQAWGIEVKDKSDQATA
jgi:hypothetical protein